MSREVVAEEYEKEFNKFNGMSSVRNVAKDFQKEPTDVGESEVSTIEDDEVTRMREPRNQGY